MKREDINKAILYLRSSYPDAKFIVPQNWIDQMRESPDPRVRALADDGMLVPTKNAPIDEEVDRIYPDWPKCPVEGCENNTCLALESEFCFPHTPGWAWWKRLKINIWNIWRKYA